MWTNLRRWCVIALDPWLHHAPRCGWCDDILPLGEVSEDEEFGDVCTQHIDTGELPREQDDDGDPDAAHDRLTDTLAGV